MASLQARHQKGCTLGDTFRAAGNREGCACKPTFYFLVHTNGKLDKQKVGKVEKEARRKLSKVQVEEDEGAYQPIRNIRFETWADQWTASLERKRTTVRSYETTMNFAKRAFGRKYVRAVSLADISALSALMREAGAGESTRAKHLRVLAASPLPSLTSTRPRIRSSPCRSRRSPLLCIERRRTSRTTNCRVSSPRSLTASTACSSKRRSKPERERESLSPWPGGDVELSERTISIRQSFTEGKLDTPKNKRSRGHWEASERKREAELMEGVFTL
jgi:hypothetical protein